MTQNVFLNPKSDIVGSPVNLIGSGPTVMPPSSDQNLIPELVSKFKILDYPNEIIREIFSPASDAKEPLDSNGLQSSHAIIGENKIMLRLVFIYSILIGRKNNSKTIKVKSQNWQNKMEFDQS